MCRFGAPYKKPTTIFTTVSSLAEALNMRCCCVVKHIRLQGTAKVRVGDKWKSVWLTSLAGAYPPKLCRLYAAALLKHAPPTASGCPVSCADQFNRDLDACGFGSSSIQLPRCPRVFSAGWEEACGQWGTFVPKCRRHQGPGCRFKQSSLLELERRGRAAARLAETRSGGKQPGFSEGQGSRSHVYPGSKSKSKGSGQAAREGLTA